MDAYVEAKGTGPEIVRWVAVALLLVATFPGHYEPIRTGLDPSYQYALNALAGSSHVFGQDVAFTFGPLGHLLLPLDLGSNLWRSILLRLAVHALFGLCVVFAARRAGRAWQVALFCAAYLLADALGLPYEHHLLMVIGLLVTLSLHARCRAWVPAGMAGLLTAFGLVAKLTLGIAGLSILALGESFRMARPESRNASATLATALAFGLAVAALSVAMFGSPQNLFAWARTSFELTSGYSAAMSLPSHGTVLILGQLALLVYLAVALALMRRGPDVSRAGLIFSIALLISFKHGFVRQDLHIVNFFPFALAVVAVMLLCARNGKWPRVVTAGVLFIAAVTFPAYSRTGILDLREVSRGVGAVRGINHLQALLRLPRTRDDLAAMSRENLEVHRLPAHWVRAIRDDEGRIDVFPWEITYAPANDLPWAPNPILQSYTAYTSSLDHLSAEHYADADAPEFVILEYKNIDLRHPLLGAPATFREILRNYELADGQLEPGRLLLRRSAPRFDDSLSTLEQVVAAAGEWIDVPSSDRLLFAELDMRLTLRGRLSRFAFRVPPVSMEVEYAGGERRTYRIIPATARNGLLLNFLPPTLDDLAGLMLRSSRDRVLRFRVGGTGALMYEPEFGVIWKEADSSVLPLSGSSSPRVPGKAQDRPA